MPGGLKQLIAQTYFNGAQGLRVNRPATNDAVGPTAIFTIAGGLVLVTNLVGIVTTVRTGGAGVTQLFSHSTGPTALCTVGITGLAAVGTIMTITGDPGEPLVFAVGTTVANTFPPIQGGMKGSAAGINQFGMIMGVGTITTTISIATTGATRYILTYIPLDDGASVT
jgi:hypothetical protein